MTIPTIYEDKSSTAHTKMPEERVHSIYIGISTEIADYLNAIYEKIAQKTPEKRNYDWSYHLNILSKIVDESLTDRFSQALIDEFRNDKPVILSFKGFSVRESGYVFFEPDAHSKDVINSLHERALQSTQDMGYVGYTPGKVHVHAFEPHLSLIKIEKERVSEVTGFISDHDESFEMRVGSYILGRQEINEAGRNSIAEIGEIKLS